MVCKKLTQAYPRCNNKRVSRGVSPDMANAAPEWQARNVERKTKTGGGLSTRGACWAADKSISHTVIATLFLQAELLKLSF